MNQAENPVLVRARIWAWAPEELKTEVWEQLADTFTNHCKATGLDVARAFPKPAGVATKKDAAAPAESGDPQPTETAPPRSIDPA